MISKNCLFFIAFLNCTNALILGQKAQKICQSTTSDPEQYLTEVSDPYDCTKFYACQLGQNGYIARQMRCPVGTSFLSQFLKGSCNGAHPKDIKDCYKGKSNLTYQFYFDIKNYFF